MSNKYNKKNSNYCRNKKGNDHRNLNNKCYYHKHQKSKKKDIVKDSVLNNINIQNDLLDEKANKSNTEIISQEEKQNDYQEKYIFEEPILKKNIKRINLM